MAELDDLRERQVSWEAIPKRVADIEIGSGGTRIGEIHATDASRTDFNARLAGLYWQMHRHRRTLRVGFVDSEFSVAEATVGGAGHAKVLIDGVRRYQFQPVSPHRTIVVGDDLNVQIFRRRWSGPYGDLAGVVDVNRASSMVDAPVLILIGILLAVEGKLFVVDRRPTCIDL